MINNRKLIKKLLCIIITVLFFFLYDSSFALNIGIENIFSDINKDYKYYDELKTLYERGMIFPDENGKFNPDKLLNRDEFVGILSEITCVKCIAPNTKYELIQKYIGFKKFFDLTKTNKYFYCINDAEDKGYLKGYQINSVCEDGSSSKIEAAFCPNNKIILEEALAMVLRTSGILSNYEAELIRQKIYSGEIKENLSNDVAPLNSDGSVYSFFPDFLKALEYELVEYDNKGNEKKYNLVKKEGDYLYPKKIITKEDFLYIAYVALKANSCLENDESDIGLDIVFYPSSCNSKIINTCKSSNLSKDIKVYDLYGKVATGSGDLITNDNQYIWRIYEYGSGNEDQLYGKYIDNYNFGLDGNYKVSLRVITDNGQTGEVYRDISFLSNKKESIQNYTSVSIRADKISCNAPCIINLEGIVSESNQDSSFIWNFGDGNIGFGKNTDHFYKGGGNYEITLTVIDNKRVSGNANIIIKVNDSQVNDTSNSYKDYDGDGVNDNDDLCPSIPGPISNNGCPLYNKNCLKDIDCNEGYYCLNGFCEIKKISNNCYYSGGDIIIGNVICDSCPCDYKVDFISNIRKCDVVFPAILSPDGKSIYSKGNYYELK